MIGNEYFLKKYKQVWVCIPQACIQEKIHQQHKFDSGENERNL